MTRAYSDEHCFSTCQQIIRQVVHSIGSFSFDTLGWCLAGRCSTCATSVLASMAAVQVAATHC